MCIIVSLYFSRVWKKKKKKNEINALRLCDDDDVRIVVVFARDRNKIVIRGILRGFANPAYTGPSMRSSKDRERESVLKMMNRA